MVKHKPLLPQVQKENKAIILKTKPQPFQEKAYFAKIFPPQLVSSIIYKNNQKYLSKYYRLYKHSYYI